MPVEILSPHPSEITPTCQIQIHLESPELQPVEILLHSLQVQGLNKYANFDILSQASEKGFGLYRLLKITDLNHFDLDFPEMVYVKTLCEEGLSESFVSEPQKSVISFFPSLIFEKSPIQRCRLVIYNEEQRSLKVSQVLNIQGRWSQIVAQVELNIDPTHNPIDKYRSAAIIRVSNKGKAPTSVRIRNIKAAPIKFRPFYGNPLPQGKIGIFPVFKVPAVWIHLEKNRPLTNSDQIEIAAGETITLSLESQASLRCPIGSRRMDYPHLNAIPCNEPLYLGSDVQMNFPKIYSSHWTTSGEKIWPVLPIQAKGLKATSLRNWIPNSELTRQCHRFPIQKRYPAHQKSRWFLDVKDCVVQ